MFLGYNTNGFAHHRLDDALKIIAMSGYKGVALTPDVHHFSFLEEIGAHDAFDSFFLELDASGLSALVVETGARYLLDPYRKHQPTLISALASDRRRRLEFLTSCVGLAAHARPHCVSFWSGAADDDADFALLMSRLVDGCKRLADYAASRAVRLAFEPEPGMFIDTMDKFTELHARVNHPAFGLTIDVGHLVCNRELPVSWVLTDWKHVLWNVHIEDMKAGVHDHLMFGDGEVDFADVFAGLRAANYTGGVYVELSRHSYDAVNTARKAQAFLAPYLTGG